MTITDQINLLQEIKSALPSTDRTNRSKIQKYIKYLEDSRSYSKEFADLLSEIHTDDPEDRLNSKQLSKIVGTLPDTLERARQDGFNKGYEEGKSEAAAKEKNQDSKIHFPHQGLQQIAQVPRVLFENSILFLFAVASGLLGWYLINHGIGNYSFTVLESVNEESRSQESTYLPAIVLVLTGVAVFLVSNVSLAIYLTRVRKSDIV